MRTDTDGNKLLKGMYYKNNRYYLVVKNQWTSLDRSYKTSVERYYKLKDTAYLQPLDEYLSRAWRQSKNNAKGRRKKEFTLTRDYVLQLMSDQNYKCAVTGTPFTTRRCEKTNRCPLAPSIDRIDNDIDYHEGNVRLVCVSANYAMNQWGEEYLYEMFKNWKKLKSH